MLLTLSADPVPYRHLFAPQSLAWHTENCRSCCSRWQLAIARNATPTVERQLHIGLPLVGSEAFSARYLVTQFVACHIPPLPLYGTHTNAIKNIWLVYSLMIWCDVTETVMQIVCCTVAQSIQQQQHKKLKRQH